LYLVIIQKFIETSIEQGSSSLQFTDYVKNASLHINSSDFHVKLAHMRERLQVSTYYAKFQSFIDEMASKDTNWRFWKQFVLEEMLAYISVLT